MIEMEVDNFNPGGERLKCLSTSMPTGNDNSDIAEIEDGSVPLMKSASFSTRPLLRNNIFTPPSSTYLPNTKDFRRSVYTLVILGLQPQTTINEVDRKEINPQVIQQCQ